MLIGVTPVELVLVTMVLNWPLTLLVALGLGWAAWREQRPAWRWRLGLLALAVVSPLLWVLWVIAMD
ncbi:hypothetical protein [Pseudoroseomonas cervicalis]|uniref:hypothetical protein n=1 Tax=Teichococcus cervicalis TaxID=204525 RepID=UPI002788396E|nr:hypothetical protein [Pseudoroseomonas cervicalis]MDQ1080160.1 lipopolysaccharide export system protein LptC [Pseudoroseomonas cervicalis]